ncbi:leucyl aminopeptidase [Fusobacterium varium]|uniref:leucyl aminopeptidase n=1 Tax=Fusobacterium varium TaxID=856 RepID=UPI00241DB84A|nr:leucyl aminopeptidase [Fusobacterium varium]
MSLEIIEKIEGIYSKTVSLVSEGDFRLCEYISDKNKIFIEKVMEKNSFTGKKGEKLEVSFLEGEALVTILFLGIGKKENMNRDVMREVIYNGLKDVTGDILIGSEDKELIDIEVIGEVAEHIDYKFNKYMSEKKDKKLNIYYFMEKNDINIIEGKELGKIINIVRDLINEPACVITPEKLAEEAEKLGKEFGFEVEIMDEKEAEKLGMKAFLAVGRASINRPKVIVMRYNGDSESEKRIGLVGKGLTYDTGGLSLKPTSSMLDMKTDMGGAATVIGTMCTLGKMKIRRNVTAVVAACENAIGSNAYRPGDIIGSMNGKTIEITNTDAEGRLTLADALTYIIRKENVDEVIDAATLTGAIMVALGDNVTGVFSNSDENYKKLEAAGKYWGEKYWQMPIFEEYRDIIKSDVADLKNSAGRLAGSITAAKFLEEFIEEKPWMHLDIAGTAFSEKNGKYFKKGATGQVVRTLYSYIKG